MSSNSHGPGVCAIRGSCGKKGIFGQPLPCPDSGPADATDEEFRELLTDVCGPAWPVPETVCCTRDQVTTLRQSLQQAEPLISSCPACRNNFRSFFCHFTCSPDQSLFVNVTATQETDTGKEAVESLDFFVDRHFKKGFYNSCKDVQFGATNGFAMDLIGGGAKDADAFLKYLGDKKPGLGSPFQINFPDSRHSEMRPLNVAPLDCSANDLAARCTCVDCPAVCATLPYVEPPRPPNSPVCTVGTVSCLTFSMLIIYSVTVLAGVLAYSATLGLKMRKNRKMDRLALLSDRSAPISPGIEGPREVPEGTINPFSHHAMDPSSTSRSRSATNASRGDASSRYRLGGASSLLDPIEQLQPRQSKINIALRSFFYRLGWNCATKPALTFALTAVVIALLNIGWKFFAIETDPVRLWVSPKSEAASQKQFFDKTFGPFYRPQQVFVMGVPSNYQEEEDGEMVEQRAKLPPPSPVLSYDSLDWWLQREQEIRELKSEPHGYTLQDVCFAPAGPGSPCVVQSISAWLGTDMSNWADDDSEYSWRERIRSCAARPAECLPEFGQPIDPNLILGGSDKDWLDAKSLVVTWVTQNSLDQDVIAKAEEWEQALERYLAAVAPQSLQQARVQLAYSTGSSLEEELNKSTNTDVKIVVASYLVMFLYISLTLGSGISSTFFWGPEGIVSGGVDLIRRAFIRVKDGKNAGDESRPNPAAGASPSRKRRYMTSILPTLLSVNSKFMLGLFGIIIVLVAVSSSVGLFSLLGVRVTLIIAEVIPFLVLAVGVDNVFILVHELNRQNALHGPGSKSNVSQAAAYANSMDEEVETPTHLPPEERIARTLGRMGPSILLSATTEVVAFGLGALVPMPAVSNFALYAAGSVLLGALLQMTVFVSAMALDLKRTEDTRMDCLPCIRLRQPIGLYDVDPVAPSSESVIGHFIRWHYAPRLLSDGVRQLVLAAFGGLFVVAIVGMQRITLGLDQRLALPSDSYLIPYFDAVDAYLGVGPPVYFVATGADITKRHGQQQLCGRFTTCLDFSIANELEAERKRPESSYLASPPAAWIDDFLHWTDPILDTCCRVRKADPSVFCTPRDSERLCRPCFEDQQWDITMIGLPEGQDTMRYLDQWLKTPTDDNCPLGGQASYGSAVAIASDNRSVTASHFRTFHTPLKTQEDFINALAAARRIAKDITARTGVHVFPYSLFYVFFDQYAHVVGITVQVLALALGAVLCICSVLLGSWRTGGVVALTCALATLGVAGIMGFWGVSLNAISLVNLVISLGIAVEFCSHIARSFMGASQGLAPNGMKERQERALSALVDVGPSVGQRDLSHQLA